MPQRIVALHSWQSDMLVRLSKQWMDIVQGAVSPYKVELLYNSDASRVYNPSFSLTLKDPTVVMITGLAHGTETTFTGFKGEAIFSSPLPDSEAPEIRDKIIHLLSCSTAATLGEAFVAAKCRAFIGYSDVVNIDLDASWVSTFLKCDAQVDIALAAGKSVGEAIQNARNCFVQEGLPQGQLLKSYGDDGATLGGAGIAPNAIPGRMIPSYELPVANEIPSRII